jgi:hypothetical protein
MFGNARIPARLRERIEKELETGESIQWLEQPIARFFTRTTAGIFLAGLLSLGFTVFWLSGWLEMTGLQGARTGDPIGNFVRNGGVLVGIVMGIFALVPLAVPLLHWQEVRGTLYAITNRRAIVLKSGSPRVVQSFFPREPVVIERRENADGSGDLIVFIHREKDFDGDTFTKELGFKYLREPREFERRLLGIDRGGI